ncbi:MAG: hypothetical protein UT61_C0062G0005 [Candidatus Woesebacteria bacterium GW2011_GWA1_39_8]|uniref:Uncharacterized protein n=1 Tax=Candidatus Woesebacteria bacterium GW2011_GWA1_39_8 TaxID=1618552 RepID=A0A0G0RZP6_9BACT|nr:MAG: hypothetical protein UT61_C0062G0005 [Candidatus Woesebacteria bacterium GW2011_GWA1_39_8]
MTYFTKKPISKVLKSGVKFDYDFETKLLKVKDLLLDGEVALTKVQRYSLRRFNTRIDQSTPIKIVYRKGAAKNAKK